MGDQLQGDGDKSCVATLPDLGSLNYPTVNDAFDAVVP